MSMWMFAQCYSLSCLCNVSCNSAWDRTHSAWSVRSFTSLPVQVKPNSGHYSSYFQCLRLLFIFSPWFLWCQQSFHFKNPNCLHKLCVAGTAAAAAVNSWIWRLIRCPIATHQYTDAFISFVCYYMFCVLPTSESLKSPWKPAASVCLQQDSVRVAVRNQLGLHFTFHPDRFLTSFMERTLSFGCYL